MGSSVLLRTEGLLPLKNSREPLDLAILAGSMMVLLGDGSTVAPRLAMLLAGQGTPASGRILLQDGTVDLKSSGDRGEVVYVPGAPVFPGGISLRSYLALAAAAAGHTRKDRDEILTQIMGWCSIEEHSDREASGLGPDTRYTAAFAAACLPVPSVMVLQGPFPVGIHSLLEDLCQGGSAVVACLPGVEYMPQITDRIALCDASDVRATVRFNELSEACASMMRLRVKFFPALPRAVMESLPGARDVVAVPGGYEFQHGGLSTAVTNLVNLARANSRQIAGLEVRPPANSRLIEYFTPDEENGEADLFCGEDLDI